MTAPTKASDLPAVDLRSDTVTRPTPAMRRALAEAEVGDEALGDDPTMRRLEERIAALLGKDRALFFPSGTMANQAALAALGRPGTGVLVEARSHIVHWEEGAAALHGGLQLRPVDTPDGLMTADRVRAAMNPPSRYLLQDGVVAVENTHMDAGGRVVPLHVLEGIRALADERGLKVHLDGARLWNAAAATGASLSELAGPADTVMVSLSKGLGAPIGSMLAGDAATMDVVWHVRRRMGGAMRQTGILAGAALHALDHHVERLEEDHALARELAQGLRDLSGVRARDPETNIVFIDLEPGAPSADNLLNFLKNRRILMTAFSRARLRAVTHLDVDPRGIARTLAALAEALEQT